MSIFSLLLFGLLEIVVCLLYLESSVNGHEAYVDLLRLNIGLCQICQKIEKHIRLECYASIMLAYS